MKAPRLAIISALVPVFILTLARAQDLKMDFQKMKERIESSNSLHIKMTIDIFSDSDRSDLLLSYAAEVKRLDDEFISILNDHEMIFNRNYSLVIDHKSRTISISKRIKTEAETIKTGQLAQLDTLLSSYMTAGELLSDVNGEKHYRFTQQRMQIRQTDVYMTADGLFRAIEYTYTNGQVARITFNVFEVPASLSADDFSEKKFLNTINESFTTTPSYRKYVIL